MVEVRAAHRTGTLCCGPGTGSATIRCDGDPTPSYRRGPQPPPGRRPAPRPRPARSAGPDPAPSRGRQARERPAGPPRGYNSGSTRSTPSSPRRSGRPSSSSTRTTSATLSSTASGRRAICSPTPGATRCGRPGRRGWRRPGLFREHQGGPGPFVPAQRPSRGALEGHLPVTWPLEIWIYPRSDRVREE